MTSLREGRALGLPLAVAFCVCATFSGCGERSGSPGSAAGAATTDSELDVPGTIALPEDVISPDIEDFASPVEIGSVTIRAAPGINRGQRVAVDLVFVYEPGLLAEIEKLTPYQWFRDRDALAKSAGDALAVLQLQVAPGGELPETPVDAPPGGLAAFLFADYGPIDQAPPRLEGAGQLAVELTPDGPSCELIQ